MKKAYFCRLLFLVLSIGLSGCFAHLYAQESDQHEQNSHANPHVHHVDSSMAISPAFMPVNFAYLPGTFFNPVEYEPVDISMFHKTDYDPLCSSSNLYQQLGTYGQAHKSMLFDYQHEPGFSMLQFPYPLYFKQLKYLKYYDVQTSFTDLAYTIGFAPEHNFSATHTQKIRQFNYAVNLNGYSNNGQFMNQKTQMLDLNLILHYETPKDVYGVTAAYILNHLNCQENGGISDYSLFTNRNFWEDMRDPNKPIANPSAFSVTFPNAVSRINTHDAFVQQYVNLKDKKGRYYGTLVHSTEFGKVSSNFLDYNLNNDFYQNQYYINTDTTSDSLNYYNVVNTLQWANYKPLSPVSDNNYFIRIAAGIRHEYVNAEMPFYRGNNFTTFARTNIRLFKVWDLYGSFAYSFNHYNRNDAIANLAAQFTISKKMKHYIGGGIDFYRVSPDFLYTFYIGNNNVWYNDFRKENNLKVNAFWTIFDYKLSFNYYHLGNYVYLNSHFEPTVCEKSVDVVQFNFFAPVRYHNFYMDANLALQHSTQGCVSVPLFAGKLHAAYAFNIFRKRLRIMIGGDLLYNTAYTADGYNPILHQFYVQKDVKVGNFLYFDASLTLQVQRISFFVKGGNLIAGVLNYNYFTTPYYPMQAQNVRIGITWRFYD